MRLFTAFRAFFATLGNAETASKVVAVLNRSSLPELEAEPEPAKLEPPKPKPQQPPKSAATGQSEAITLMAMLQREARLVDFLQESLENYSDAQVGAAARTVHSESAKVIARVFDLAPLLSEPEQSIIEIAEADATKYQFVGNLRDKPPYRGTLMHPGWKAQKCELPKWTGKPDSALIIAPAEIELK